MVDSGFSGSFLLVFAEDFTDFKLDRGSGTSADFLIIADCLALSFGACFSGVSPTVVGPHTSILQGELLEINKNMYSTYNYLLSLAVQFGFSYSSNPQFRAHFSHEKHFLCPCV